MKRISATLISFIFPLLMMAQGWPANYPGVMLQGFYWDSYSDSKWTNLESQADELSKYFDLIWIPQSGWTGSTNSMGYNDIYWYDQRSAFGNENELKSMIKTYKNKGVGIIADVVINHRGGATRWTDFPTETNPYDGKSYSMTLSDICNTDEYNTSADAASERSTYGKATGVADTGDNFNGLRDLDHTSTNVQNNVKAYLKYLLNYLGYAGFRYDMVKGYAGRFTGIYNADANPIYSVGEYWDGNASNVENWLNATKVNGNIESAAFDFPQKYLMNNNLSNYSNWYSASGSLNNNSSYKQYSVTFVDNHDSYRDANKYTGDVPSANAWILANPGTPCIFLPHWQAYKSEIGAMIKVRKAIGITNTSSTNKLYSNSTFIETTTTGTNGNLITVIGDISKATIPSGYTLVLSGTKYAYYSNIAIDLDVVTVDKISGTYDNSITATIKTPTNSTYVYTTDGSTPSAINGTQSTGTKALTFTTNTTLKIGILSSGVVKDIQTYNYTIVTFTPTKATVYVHCDTWSPLYFYAWDDNGQLNGGWPGKAATATKVIDNKTWYYQTFDVTGSSYKFNFIFSQNGTPQTVDITGINSDKYYELSSTKDGNGKYYVTDVTSTTGINGITTDNSASAKLVKVYTISGQLLRSLPKGTSVQNATDGLPHGIYIVDNKKIAK